MIRYLFYLYKYTETERIMRFNKCNPWFYDTESEVYHNTVIKLWVLNFTSMLSLDCVFSLYSLQILSFIQIFTQLFYVKTVFGLIKLT